MPLRVADTTLWGYQRTNVNYVALTECSVRS
jgi:hypothetical protein